MWAIHCGTAATPPSFLRRSQSLFKRGKSTLTMSCLLGYTSSTHTHTVWGPQLPSQLPRPFGWCHLLGRFCGRLTGSRSGLLVPRGHMMELPAPTCRRLVSRPETKCLTIVDVLPLINAPTAEARCVLGRPRRLRKSRF